MLTHHLRTTGLLSLLVLYISPAQIHTGENTSSHGYHFTATHKTLLITGIAATLFVCSNDARATLSQSARKSLAAGLRLLQKMTISTALRQKIQAKIDYLEAVDSTRSGSEPIGNTPELILKLLKMIKDVVDALKALEWVLG